MLYVCEEVGIFFFLFFLEYTHKHFQINADRGLMVE